MKIQGSDEGDGGAGQDSGEGERADAEEGRTAAGGARRPQVQFAISHLGTIQCLTITTTE